MKSNSPPLLRTSISDLIKLSTNDSCDTEFTKLFSWALFLYSSTSSLVFESIALTCSKLASLYVIPFFENQVSISSEAKLHPLKVMRLGISVICISLFLSLLLKTKLE